MLTRELLLYRTLRGELRPSFVSREDSSLVSLAEQLLSVVARGVGASRDEVEEVLFSLAGAFPQPRVAKGVVKLLLDKLEFDEAPAEIAATRARWLPLAGQVLRALPPGATLEDYERRLPEALGAPLAEVRTRLYADLPGHRKLLDFEPLTAEELLDRYNLGLAQGLLLGARRITVRAHAPELLRVRKVLRWLKFCRLVAEVKREQDDWTLEVEGPGTVLDLQKKYGLQLASFLTAVPVLQRWTLSAEVQVGRRHGTLSLDHTDPLVSPLPSALGHIPPEVATLAQGFADEEWKLDLTPLPRHVGATGLCVPDLLFHHRGTGREVALELFHAWHATSLLRRLDELKTRPDPGLLLGVERALAKGRAQHAALEEHPQVILFHGFPSAKRVREKLSVLLPGQETGSGSGRGRGRAGLGLP